MTFEIITLGTGGGYGESVLINFCDNWVVIDCCKDPKTKDIIPLKYLKDRGIKIENSVKLIICTHWHDDHINGVSEMFQNCQSARICFPVADSKKFLQFAGLDYKKYSGNHISQCSTYEFNQCVSIIRNRKAQILKATQDRLIFKANENDNIIEIFTLSPSDKILEDFDLEISNLVENFGSKNKKIVLNSPNHKSTVIYVKVDKYRVLLGSDLEDSIDQNKGWKAIFNTSTTLDKDSSTTLFKIPHHGSENGFNVDIWDNVVSKNSISVITPWNRNNKLPQENMIKKYKELSEKLYITSKPNFNRKAKTRPDDIEKFIKTIRPSLTEIKFSEGIVYNKIVNDNWQTNLEGSALEL